MQGSFSIEIDRANALVRVTGVGFWSPDSVARHFEELGKTMAALRREAGHVLVLVDLRNATVQSKETAAVIGASTRQVYAQADRAAVVVSTGLLNMQIKHVTDAEKIRTFTDLAQAERWLRTHRQSVTTPV